MRTLLWVAASSAASVSLGGVLVNGDFNEPPVLNAGQSDVDVDSSKMIVPAVDLVANPDDYYNAISGITGWVAGSYGNGVSDHGISRATKWGDQADPRMLFIDNWTLPWNLRNHGGSFPSSC